MRFQSEDLLWTVEYLSDAADVGFDYLAYPRDRHLYTGNEIEVFQGKADAQQYADFRGDWHVQPLAPFLENLNAYAERVDLPPIVETGYYYHNQKNSKTMNLNNLENLKEEMKNLGFKDKLIEQMEENMRKDVPDFKLHDTLPAARGHVDLTLHFKQSNQSDYYYFNKFEASHNKGKGLEEGQKYMIISPNPNEEGKNIVKKMDNVGEAIEFFKSQQGNSELAVGKDAAHKTMLVSMEKGKVNYVSKDFKGTFYNKPIGQTFWIDRGKGFNADQAANLVQGRAVYKDDLMNLSGDPYKAWMTLDVEKGKDRFGNFSMNQYNDPSYGFNLKETLEKFNIKELDDPKKMEKLEESLKNGNRPMITVEKDGQPHKLFIEAVPRFRSMNLFEENGAIAKREQFMKQPNLSQGIAKGKENEMAASQGMGM